MEEAKTIDARGLSCPQPAMMTHKALRSATQGTIRVLVDSATARDGVVRMAQKANWQIMIKSGSGGGYIVELKK